MAHDARVDIGGDVVGEAGHGRGRLVAVATVLTTLIAASIGYLQTDALWVHDEADVRAERLGALAGNVAAVNRDQALVQVDRYRKLRHAELQAHAAEASAARQPSALAEARRWRDLGRSLIEHGVLIAAHQQLDAHCEWESDRCGYRDLAPICFAERGPSCAIGASFNPYGDRLTIAEYEQGAAWESYRLDALREAADAEAENAENHFAHLAASLTMLAVAVFLFGFSLTPQGRERRRLFLISATVFVVVGSGWGVYHVLVGYTKPPPGTAVALATGKVELSDSEEAAEVWAQHYEKLLKEKPTAIAGSEEQVLNTERAAMLASYEAAIGRLTHATSLWAGSGSAYSELATAIYELGELRKGAEVPETPTLVKAIESSEQAHRDEPESATAAFDLGSELLFLGLRTGDREQVVDALELSREAAPRFEGQWREHKHPAGYLISSLFTIAEAELALGLSTASHDYCVATRQMLKSKAEIPVKKVDEAAHSDVTQILYAHRYHRKEAARLLAQVDEAARTGQPKCD